ncbi:MAG: hypothetical protein HC831_18095, partial [Chloroflexia bacterium]|nr:hypothetical protein [Chloroflexia bacterium]
MPEKEEVMAFVKSSPFYRNLISLGEGTDQFIEEKHILAKKYIETDKLEEALKILLFERE